MGILAPKIEGNEAEKKIAAALSKPWYQKVESWLTVVNIIALIINTVLLLKQFKPVESIPSSTGSAQETKCFSYTTYDASTKAWRWRAEHLNEYFPTKEDAVKNCVAMLGGIINANSGESQN